MPPRREASKGCAYCESPVGGMLGAAGTDREGWKWKLAALCARGLLDIRAASPPAPALEALEPHTMAAWSAPWASHLALHPEDEHFCTNLRILWKLDTGNTYRVNATCDDILQAVFCAPTGRLPRTLQLAHAWLPCSNVERFKKEFSGHPNQWETLRPTIHRRTYLVAKVAAPTGGSAVAPIQST